MNMTLRVSPAGMTALNNYLGPNVPGNDQVYFTSEVRGSARSGALRNELALINGYKDTTNVAVTLQNARITLNIAIDWTASDVQPNERGQKDSASITITNVQGAYAP